MLEKRRRIRWTLFFINDGLASLRKARISEGGKISESLQEKRKKVQKEARAKGASWINQCNNIKEHLE